MRHFPTVAATLCLAALCASPAAGAYSNGTQTARSMRGCGGAGCHDMNPGATVTIEGPATLAPGARATYTLVVSSTRADFMAAGFDVHAAGAALEAMAAQQVLVGEVTHRSPVRRSGADVRVPFTVVAPATPGCLVLFAAGNAVNLSGDQTGDAWGIAALPVMMPGGPDAGSCIRPDAGTRVELYDPTNSMAYGVCSVGRGAGVGARRGAWALALGALGVALARRRR